MEQFLIQQVKAIRAWGPSAFNPFQGHRTLCVLNLSRLTGAGQSVAFLWWRDRDKEEIDIHFVLEGYIVSYKIFPLISFVLYTLLSACTKGIKLADLCCLNDGAKS